MDRTFTQDLSQLASPRNDKTEGHGHIVSPGKGGRIYEVNSRGVKTLKGKQCSITHMNMTNNIYYKTTV